MAAKPPPLSPSKLGSQAVKVDGNGNGVSNEILLRLPEGEITNFFLNWSLCG